MYLHKQEKKKLPQIKISFLNVYLFTSEKNLNRRGPDWVLRKLNSEWG